MISPPARTNTADMPILVSIFYLLWTAAVLACFSLPVPDNPDRFQLHLFLFLFSGFYLLLASSFTYRLGLAVMEERRNNLWKYGAAVVLLFFLLHEWGAENRWLTPFIAGLSTANLLFGAILAGTVLSSAVKRFGELIPVCIAAATADLMSVAMGPTKSMIEDIRIYYESGMEGRPPLVDSLMVKAAIPGFDMVVPLFGVTDWIFISLLTASLLRLNTSDNILPGGFAGKTRLFLPVSVVGLYGGLILAQVTQKFLPAMVVIALSFLGYLFIKLKVHREIKGVDVAYSLVFSLGIIVLIYFFSL